MQASRAASEFSPEAARELRESLGYTLQQMADALQLSGRYRWSEYERGARIPSPQTWALALIVAGRHPLYGPYRRPVGASGEPPAPLVSTEP